MNNGITIVVVPIMTTVRRQMEIAIALGFINV